MLYVADELAGQDSERFGVAKGFEAEEDVFADAELLRELEIGDETTANEFIPNIVRDVIVEIFFYDVRSCEDGWVIVIF